MASSMAGKHSCPAQSHWSGAAMRQCSGNCPEGKELARTDFRTHISNVLADEQTSPEQFAIYRRMTPGRRLALAEQLYWTARRMKSAWLRELHPDWTEQRVEAEVSRIFLNEPEKISLP
jgi:hypothetical protein